MTAEHWFLGAGITLCLFSLWVIARHDWLRLTRRGQHAIGEVCGHRTTRDGDGISYAAIIRFADDSGAHEVIDHLLHQRATPPVGTKVGLTYPQGRPDLARPPRPLLWLLVYGLFLTLLGLLVARLLGWLPA